MAELVDAPDLGSGELACAGSSPVPGIYYNQSMSDHRSIKLVFSSTCLVQGCNESAKLTSAAGAVLSRIPIESREFMCRFDFP